MHAVAVLLLVTCGVLYVLYHSVIGLIQMFRHIKSYVKKVYQKCLKYYAQKKYDKTLLGRVEISYRLIQSKIKEIVTAIEALEIDLSDHQNHIKSQNDKLMKNQLPEIKRVIESEIKINTQRIQIIKGYIKLFKEFLAPIYKEKNGIEALLEIIRFNTKKENIERYSSEFEKLKTEIEFYSSYDFISISNEIILHLDSSSEDLEVASAGRFLQQNKKARSLAGSTNNESNSLPLETISENKLHDLEALIFRDFENSLVEFEAVKADFKRIFKR